MRPCVGATFVARGPDDEKDTNSQAVENKQKRSNCRCESP